MNRLLASYAAGGAALLLAASPAAAPVQQVSETDKLDCATVQDTMRMPMYLGRSRIVRLPEPATHFLVGNPAVAQARMLDPGTLYVLAADAGSTNLIVRGRSGACAVFDVTVGMDAPATQLALAAAFPDEKEIVVTSVMDSLVLTGTVADGATVAKAGELAAAFVRKPAAAVRAGVSATQGGKDEQGGVSTGQSVSASATLNQGQGPRVVNLLNVRGPQQVMLEVKIAEVSKTLLERLEAGATFKFSAGSWAGSLLSSFLTGRAQSLFDAKKTNGNQITASAQKQDSLVRILAEPNVMAISGQEGSFRAGGKILVPVAQDENKVTLEEKEFGVGLTFTPTVLADGRINLKVAPEVSELSREGIGVTAIGITGGSILPLITERKASTTVQLYDGQSFVIGGLLKNNLVTNFKGLPGLGEVPILGALFRSVDYQQEKTELVFLVTPRLVKPLSGRVPLPTDAVAPNPGRVQALLGSKFEANAADPAEPPRESPSGFELR